MADHAGATGERATRAQIRTCQAGGVLSLRLHDDLHLLAAAGLHDAAAGAHAVLLGAGGLHLEGHAVARGVLQGQRARHILAQLKPALGSNSGERLAAQQERLQWASRAHERSAPTRRVAAATEVGAHAGAAQARMYVLCLHSY